MSRSLQMAILGTPQIQSQNKQLTAELVSAKGQALLIFLALNPGHHSRSALAGLLWGDLPEESARANLRLTLSRLRNHVPEALLLISRPEVALEGAIVRENGQLAGDDTFPIWRYKVWIQYKTMRPRKNPPHP